MLRNKIWCVAAVMVGLEAAAAEAPYAKVPRLDFNRLAVELNLPLFWVEDKNQDGNVDANEVATPWGMTARPPVWSKAGALTPEFKKAYGEIEKRHAAKSAIPKGTPAPEATRQQLVLDELAQGRPTIVLNDLSALDAGEKKFVEAIIKAATIIEKLYAHQMGMDGFEAKLPKDAASRQLFWRNQGFACAAPKTQTNPECSAIPGAPKGKLSGLYPKALLGKEGFCDELGKKDKALMEPFVVVAEEKGAPKAVPYTTVWKKEMADVSKLLADAARSVDATKEAALKAYLEAASKSFTTNDWVPADEAWAKMNVSNSKWYLRIAPDEVYAEPCSTKALFHVSFARINEASLKWQNLLDPLKGDMEKALADLAGPPYAARQVSFHLPDFIDIVLNAGDSRDSSGATIGQSLPNFGPVANEGRGRTVAMTNLYLDADSMAAAKSTAEAMLCPDAMAVWTADPEPQLMSVVLHEAAHNLGPAHQYTVAGKTDREQFGGPLASTMEELKAQSAALYFTDWLAEKKLISQDQSNKAHVRDLMWAFGHISRGMYDENKAPKNYSQLAAIQLGNLMRGGAVSWKKDSKAANGTDLGCFSVDLKKYPVAVKAMMKLVAGLKSRGDKAGAEKLIAEDVDVTGDKKALHEVITERALRAPKASFVYAVSL
jgi:hypothetical protein